MNRSRSTARVVLVGCASGALALGIATAPAQATPGAAAKTLAGMKYSWALKPAALQVAECNTYRNNEAIAISSAVSAIARIPSAAGKLTPAETRSVATKYLRWACSGPGRTPRP